MTHLLNHLNHNFNKVQGEHNELIAIVSKKTDLNLADSYFNYVNSNQSEDSEMDNNIPEAIDTQVGTGFNEFLGTEQIESDDPVDFYRVFLNAGDRLTVDVDSDFDPVLNLFDAAGLQFDYSDDEPAPGESFGLDPYLDFTALVNGFYYIGLTGYGNTFYDPFDTSNLSGGSTGTYDIAINRIAFNDGDRYEENDTAETATVLSPIVDGFYAEYDLSVEPNDPDWYEFTTDASGEIAISIFFTDSLGDLDLRVYDAEGNFLEGSFSTSDNEEVVLSNTTPGTYRVEVYGYLGTDNPSYSLEINTPTPPPVMDDVYEDNDDRETPTNVTPLIPNAQTSFTLPQLVIVGEDEDWFEFELFGTGDANSRLGINFSDFYGDLDLELRRADFSFVNGSYSVTDNESISLQGLGPGSYLARVYGYNFGQDSTNSYSLSLTGPITNAQDQLRDRFEDNDTAATAPRLAISGSEAYFSDLAIEAGDDDWYLFELPSDGQFDSEVAVYFDHALGDMELQLFRASDTDSVIRQSTSVTDNEYVSLSGLQSGDYLIRVYGYLGVENPDYSLSLTLPQDDGSLGDDDFEDNDTFETAANLTDGRQLQTGVNVYEDLIINGTDDDWFRFALPDEADEGSSLRVIFRHAEGDIDVELYDSENDYIDGSFSASNNEEIDLSGLSAGEYYVQVYGYGFGDGDINQYDLDITYLPVEIPMGGEDGFEDNDTFETATILGSWEGTQIRPDLSVESGDDDWFQFTTLADGEVQIDLRFHHNLGDVDLRIFDADNNYLGGSFSVTDDESLALNLDQGTYYARVYGYAGASNPNYDLEITLPGGGGMIDDDTYEDNDTLETAAELRGLINGLNTFDDLVALSGDDDYYRFNLPGTGGLGNELRIEFEHSDGDLDLALYRVEEDDTFSLIEESQGIADSETISLSGEAAGDYVALVYGYSGASNSYSMMIDLPAGGSEDDIFEENNSRETATLLRESQRVEGLNITEGDEDWFRFNLLEDGDSSDRIRVDFTHALGDVDIQLWSDNEAETFPIRISQGLGNSESISLDGLAEGQYFLRVYGFAGATNPEYSLDIQAPLDDLNDDNDNESGGSLRPDVYEENDFATSASDLGIVRGLNEYSALSIDQPGDDDWYRFSTVGAGNVEVMIDFDASLGDVDLELFSPDDTSTPLTSSTGMDNSELVTWTSGTAGEEFLVRVYGFAGATNPDYELSITGPVGDDVSPDEYEDNDTLATASRIGDFRANRTGATEIQNLISVEDLTIHSDSVIDQDWFAFQTQAEGISDSQVAIQSAQGDLTLALFDVDGNLIAESATEGSSYETLSLNQLPASNYYVQITSADGSTNPDYSLTLNPPSPPIGGPDPAPGGDDSWTILVYVAADNDLERFAIRDINEMESVQLPDNINIVAQVDRISGYDRSNGDWTDTRRGLIQYDPNNNSNSGQLISLGESTSIGEVNMGDPQTLQDFITWGTTNYAAENYALVIWNHGAGLPGAAWDDTDGGDNLTIPEVTQAVDASNIDFGLIGFDACLQALIEQGYDLAQYTDVFVAAQDLEPGDGWDYAGLLQRIAEDPNLDPEQLGAAIVSSYEDFYNRREVLSAIRTSGYGAIVDAINTFTTATIDNATEDDWNAIIQARYSTPNFYYEDYRDLAGFMTRLAGQMPTAAIADAATAVATAVEDSVISQVDGLGATGMNIFLPPANGNIQADYTENNLNFLADTGWDEFLDGMTSRTGTTRVRGDILEENNATRGVALRDNNNSFANATDLGLLSGAGEEENSQFTNLSIQPGDVDWLRWDFRVQADVDSNVSIISEEAASLNLELYDSDRVQLGEQVDGTETINLSDFDIEPIIQDGEQIFRYYVRVAGDDANVTVSDYDLVVNAPVTRTVEQDWAELEVQGRNDLYTKATDLGSISFGQQLHFDGLTIDPFDVQSNPNDPLAGGDWYVIQPSRGTDFNPNIISLEFAAEQANLDLYAYRENDETRELDLLDSSVSLTAGEESVSFQDDEGDILSPVYIRVISEPLAEGEQPRQIRNYELEIVRRQYDIDGDGEAGTGDAFMIVGDILGFADDNYLERNTGAGADRTFGDELRNRIDTSDLLTDVDGNGVAETGDAFMIAGQLLGFADDAYLERNVGVGATRTTAEELRQYMQDFLPEFNVSTIG